MDADLLFKANQEDDMQGFKLDLQSIRVQTQIKTDQDAKTGGPSWQDDLRGQITEFEQSFAQRKALLLSKLDDVASQEARQSMVDTFLSEMNSRSVQVLQSQSYARMQVLDTK